MTSSAQILLDLLAESEWRLATCESLTGGALGAAITAVPGASRVYRGGLITYASDLKVTLAGVDADLAAAKGVVNEDVARQMALGVRAVCSSDVGIATTGVAGPDPQEGQRVGTVWLAVASGDLGTHPDQVRVRTAELWLSGDRAAIRAASVQAALDLAIEHLHPLSGPGKA